MGSVVCRSAAAELIAAQLAEALIALLFDELDRDLGLRAAKRNDRGTTLDAPAADAPSVAGQHNGVPASALAWIHR
jgi:hypothetical protein